MVVIMESISKAKAIKILHQKKIAFFDVTDASKIFKTKKRKTLYELLQRLEKNGVIHRIIKGKYHFFLREYNDFELANFLVNPSYISLESALAFYGILPQFPYSITSTTPLKPKQITYQKKEYEFSHLKSDYFLGFVKKDKFLIAKPEKALLDELYFMAKKLRHIHIQDLNLDLIDKNKFEQLYEMYKFIPLQKLVKRLELC
jgi:predicted transcriptional regulator of viral defense system